MDDNSLSEYEAADFLSDFIAAEYEIFPYRAGGVHLYQNGKFLRVEEFVANPSREQLDEERKAGISGICQGPIRAHAFCYIGPEEMRIKVMLETENDKVLPAAVELAKDAISAIVELDGRARQFSESESDYYPRLSYLEIGSSEVGLHYNSTIVNAEWTVFFRKSESADTEWVLFDMG